MHASMPMLICRPATADPLLDLMDKANVVRWRLFREGLLPL